MGGGRKVTLAWSSLFLFFGERRSGDVGWWKATQTIESLVLVVGCAVEVLYRSILEMFFA